MLFMNVICDGTRRDALERVERRLNLRSIIEDDDELNGGKEYRVYETLLTSSHVV